MYKQDFKQVIKGSNYLLLFSAHESASGELCSVWGSSLQRRCCYTGMSPAEGVQQRAIKMIRGWNMKHSEDKVRQLGLFSLKKRTGIDFIFVFN